MKTAKANEQLFKTIKIILCIIIVGDGSMTLVHCSYCCGVH